MRTGIIIIQSVIIIVLISISISLYTQKNDILSKIEENEREMELIRNDARQIKQLAEDVMKQAEEKVRLVSEEVERLRSQQ
jgi:hypothetical protein